MANSIGLFKQYINLLDEVYQNASVTAQLDCDSALVRPGANANEIIIPKITMDGLGDYSRANGYTAGDVSLTNETVKFNYDRGRSFTVDAMDNEETAGVAFGKLASEFIRTKVVPELDAFRFATYAGASNIGSASGSLTAGSGIISALRTAATAMDEAEVTMEDRVLFITPTLFGMIQDMDTTSSREVLNRFDACQLVPQSRFYTAIDLYDGVTDTSATTGGVNEKGGGFVKASDAKDINFMVIHRGALIQYTRHMVSKIFRPEENQNADGWKFVFRSYGLADVYDNKTAGIYLHKKA